jgi:pilus assembly protein CpaF
MVDASPLNNEAVEKLTQEVQVKLLARISLERVTDLAGDTLRREIHLVVERLCDAEHPLLNPLDRERVVEKVLDESFGLGPLEILVRDPTISQITIDGPHEISCERQGGTQEKTAVKFRDNNHVVRIVNHMLWQVGRRIDETTPLIDVRLPGGWRIPGAWRVNAVIPPSAVNGPSVLMRRLDANPLKLEDLLNYKAFTPEMAMLMEAVVKAGLNIVVSGDRGSGKTALLNALSSSIPSYERLATIEDAAELQLPQSQVVRLETRRADAEGRGAVSARDLLQSTSWMAVERIVLGELQGAEAWELLRSATPFLTIVRAVSPSNAQVRLEQMLKMVAPDMPGKTARELIAAGVDLIIHVERLAGGPRKVTQITEVRNVERDAILMQDIFRYRTHSVDPNGRTVGQFEAAGAAPDFLPRLERSGIRLPKNLFEERVLLKD